MAVYAFMLVLGLRGDAEIFERFSPKSKTLELSDEFRRHVLKVRVLLILLAIMVNESLILTDAPLGLRVSVLALMPSVLHYFYWLAILLTMPPMQE